MRKELCVQPWGPQAYDQTDRRDVGDSDPHMIRALQRHNQPPLFLVAPRKRLAFKRILWPWCLRRLLLDAVGDLYRSIQRGGVSIVF